MSDEKLHVSRTTSGKQHLNTLDLRPEVRRILLAEGAEFHNDQKYYEFLIPERLIEPEQCRVLRRYPSLAIDVQDENHFAYTSYEQGVRYEVERTRDRERFKEGLQDENLFVLYGGHARYGRGPCFADVVRDQKGEFWRQGLFRMGYPFLSVPVHEIIEHEYTAPVVPATVNIAPEDCNPLLRNKVGSLRKAALQTVIGENGLRFTEGVGPEEEVWTFRGYQHNQVDDFLVLFAGWENTSSAPYDLGATDMNCRGFFHCGCSTVQLNQEMVVDRKGYAVQNDRAHSFFTSDLSTTLDALCLLYHLFSYSEPSKSRAWGPALDYAQTKANQDLARWPGRHSRIRKG